MKSCPTFSSSVISVIISATISSSGSFVAAAEGFIVISAVGSTEGVSSTGAVVDSCPVPRPPVHALNANKSIDAIIVMQLIIIFLLKITAFCIILGINLR